MKRIDVLDGLRGLAVLIVFLSHTSGREQSLSSFLQFLGIGHIGVYLFFTLSAFLLGKGLFSKPFSSNTISAFFIKRILRIAPLYYLVVSGVFFTQVIFNSYSPRYLYVSNGIQGYIEHLFFYRGDGVFWSIVSEMQFYLIVPLMGWLLMKQGRKGIVILSILASLNFILYLMKYAGISDYINYVSPNTLHRGTFIDIFIPGLIAAYFVQFKAEFLEKKQTLIHKLANTLLLGGGTLTLILVSKNFLGFNRPFYEFRFFSLLFGVSFSIIVVSLYMKNSLLERIFKLRLLRFIGKIGFSFYLLHLAVFELINKTNLDPSLKFFMSFLTVSGISYISYTLIEQPSIRLSYWLINKLKLSPIKHKSN
jgi:peptidoglycan/LPS O-acetylase OafA/YrhL